MCETTNKHKLLAFFSIANLPCYPFVKMYYSNGFTFSNFTPIYFNIPTKLIYKCPHPEILIQKLQTLARALLLVIMTFRMSEWVPSGPRYAMGT